jgi:hypothetical protein
MTIALAMTVLGGFGCGHSRPWPLQASWYLQVPSAEAGSDSSVSGAPTPLPTPAALQIALLNRGVIEIPVTKVFLNESRAAGGSRYQAEIPGGFDLEPGRLVILDEGELARSAAGRAVPFTPFSPTSAASRCFLPVSLKLMTNKDTVELLRKINKGMVEKKDNLVQVEVVGRLPSALPEAWKCPH